MDEHGGLAGQFEKNWTHLRAVAYRMLGSRSEADDAVQEAWPRLSRSDTSGFRNLVLRSPWRRDRPRFRAFAEVKRHDTDSTSRRASRSIRDRRTSTRG